MKIIQDGSKVVEIFKHTQLTLRRKQEEETRLVAYTLNTNLNKMNHRYIFQ